jgi:chemotaxis protein MotB
MSDLDAEKAKVVEKDKSLEDLNKKLNLAFIKKAEELADYRSEFFGKLKKVLSNRPDIRIVGDRFVFSSEVFFASASADLQEGGKQELMKFAETLKEMQRSMPKDVDWILSVVGHTDKLPISNSVFPSNWELSTARAISVVKFLAEQGIPPNRLAAIGYGEHQPLDAGGSSDALAKNRRIEVKIDQK